MLLVGRELPEVEMYLEQVTEKVGSVENFNWAW